MRNTKIYLERLIAKLNALFGRGQVVTMAVIVLIGIVSSVVIFLYMGSAAPNTLSIATGPVGSTFNNIAEKYKKILAKEGVTLKRVKSSKCKVQS